MLLFVRGKLEMRYYIGILILTSVGFLFVALLGFTLYYGGFGSDFSALFEENHDFLGHFNDSHRQNAMDSNFNDAFNKIRTIIYEPYMTLKNKS